jgi:hypothetical protein
MIMKAAWALSALLLASCGDDGTGVDGGRFGRYRLRTVNGTAVPAIQNETANGRLEFLSGNLRLNSDGTFTDSTEIKVTPMFRGEPLPGGEVQHYFDVAWGLHRISGDTVYLQSIRGERYFMVFQAAGSLSQTLGATTLQYRRD